MEALDSPYFPPLAENINIRCNLLSAVGSPSSLAPVRSSSPQPLLAPRPPHPSFALQMPPSPRGEGFGRRTIFPLHWCRVQSLATLYCINLYIVIQCAKRCAASANASPLSPHPKLWRASNSSFWIFKGDIKKQETEA